MLASSGQSPLLLKLTQVPLLLRDVALSTFVSLSSEFLVQSFSKRF